MRLTLSFAKPLRFVEFFGLDFVHFFLYNTGMKFRLLSDLHLEFHKENMGLFSVPALEDDKDTVLLLAGDIALGHDAKEYIRALCDRFHAVCYTLGNHEFYANYYKRVRDDWAALERDYMPRNFHFIDDTTVTIGDVRVLGGTLWTDFDKENYWAMYQARKGMNDYYKITFIEGDRYRRLLPIDTVRIHRKTLGFIRDQLALGWDGKTVVMTHHLPHPLCSPEWYRTSPLQPAYVNNLDDLIYENKIDVWVHGHTHDNVDFEIHGTRILCNPRGYYPDHLNEDFNPTFTFDV